MDLGKVITGGLEFAAKSFSGLLLALGVISALTMALLQAAKDMTGWRASFNRKRLIEWLDARARELHRRDDQGTYDLHAPSDLVSNAETELLRLATDRDQYAFYGADIDALCTQFSGAALLVMDYPRLSRELYLILTVHAQPEDVGLLLQDYQPVYPIPALAVQHYTPEQLSKSAEERHKLTETRNRIRHQVTQSISSFQVSAGSQWQRNLKFYSWGTSTALTFIAFLFSKNIDWSQIGWLVLMSAISGFLAPIARDLLAALQRLRG